MMCSCVDKERGSQFNWKFMSWITGSIVVSFTDTGKAKGKTHMREVAHLSSLPPCIPCLLLALLLILSLLFQFRCWDALLTHFGSILGNMQGTCHPSIPFPPTFTLLNLTVVGKIIDPQRWPNPWHLWLQLRTLRWEFILDHQVTESLKAENIFRLWRARVMAVRERLSLPLLAWKMEEGPKNANSFQKLEKARGQILS